MHFSKIITLLFEKERHTWLCILKLFTNIVHELIIHAFLKDNYYLSKMRGEEKIIRGVKRICLKNTRKTLTFLK